MEIKKITIAFGVIIVLLLVIIGFLVYQSFTVNFEESTKVGDDQNQDIIQDISPREEGTIQDIFGEPTEDITPPTLPS